MEELKKIDISNNICGVSEGMYIAVLSPTRFDINGPKKWKYDVILNYKFVSTFVDASHTKVMIDGLNTVGIIELSKYSLWINLNVINLTKSQVSDISKDYNIEPGLFESMLEKYSSNYR